MRHVLKYSSCHQIPSRNQPLYGVTIHALNKSQPQPYLCQATQAAASSVGLHSVATAHLSVSKTRNHLDTPLLCHIKLP